MSLSDVDRIQVVSDGKKGRSFEVTLLSYVSKGSWNTGSRDVTRPIWMVYAGSDDLMRPFTANAQTGRKIQVPDGNKGHLSRGTTFEFLKSAGHQFVPQRLPDGMTVMTVYHPDLFLLNPGMVDPEGIEFVVMPPFHWIAQHRQKFPQTPEILAYLKSLGVTQAPGGCSLPDLIPLASLFCGYLDRRTRVPLIADPRFQTQLMLRCFSARMALFASTDRGYSYEEKWGVATREQFFVHNAALAGIQFVLTFDAQHDEFTTVVAEEVDRYFKATKGRS